MKLLSDVSDQHNSAMVLSVMLWSVQKETLPLGFVGQCGTKLVVTSTHICGSWP